MSSLGSAISGGIGNVLGTMRGLPGQIIGAVGNIDLSGIGRAIMSSLGDGIKAGLQGVLDFAGSIAGKIKAIKGPESRDRQLLIDPGKWIMQGLDNGLRAELPRVIATIGDINDALGTVGSAEPLLPDGHSVQAMRSVTALTLADGADIATETGYLREMVRLLRAGTTVEIDGAPVAAAVAAQTLLGVTA
jgi:phage-related protein